MIKQNLFKNWVFNRKKCFLLENNGENQIKKIILNNLILSNNCYILFHSCFLAYRLTQFSKNKLLFEIILCSIKNGWSKVIKTYINLAYFEMGLSCNYFQ